MTALLASLILLHAPVPSPEDPTPDGPGSGSYALIDYSPLPQSINVTIEGSIDTVSARDQSFSQRIDLSDLDTYKKSTTGEEVVKGTSKLLQFRMDPDNGYIGNSSTTIFTVTGTGTPTSTDDLVVKQVMYGITPAGNTTYPVYSRVKYYADDPASSAPHVPYGGHCKDVPGGEVDEDIKVNS